MNDLADRKRLLIAQAGLHRELIARECQRLLPPVDLAQDLALGFVQRNRWWLLGGAAVGGVLLPAKWRGLLGLLPLVPGLLRSFRQ